MIYEKLLDVKDDGSFMLDMSYFDYPTGLRMTSDKFHKLFGGLPRRTKNQKLLNENESCKFNTRSNRGDIA